MIISRYITREVCQSLMGVIVVLLLAFLSQQFVRYLNYVAVGKIPTTLLLQLLGFEVPYLLALLMPLGLYLGLLLAYGRFYADNEMIIMNMGGFDQKRLLRLTMLIAFACSLIVLFLMLWLNPMISAKRQQLMTRDEATLHLIQTLIPGRFQVSPDGRHVMYVEKLSRDHQRAENVFMAQEMKVPDQPDKSAWMLVVAAQGYQAKGPSGDQFFVTTDGYRYEGTPGQNDYKIVQYKKYAVRIPPNQAEVTHFEAEALPSADLWRLYDDPENAAELQWRFSIGISTFILALLALPFSAIRPRQGRFLMLLPAILIYIVYINLLFVGRRLVEQGSVPAGLGMWWVHGLILALVLLMVVGRAKWQARKQA